MASLNLGIKVDLTKGSITQAIIELNNYAGKLEEANRLLTERLATIGAVAASINFARAIYTGNFTYDIQVEEIANGYAVIASGENIGFVEFGAGATYGYGHPDSHGYGPGTWPEGRRQNKQYANWENPEGWHIPGGQHTFGNPPNAGMYNAKEEIIRALESVAREVFA